MRFSRFILFPILLFFGLSLQAQKVLIRLKLQPGSSYRTELTRSVSFIQEFMGISYTTDTRITSVLNTEVTGFSTETGYEMKSGYSLIDFIMKAHMLDIDMSSLSGDTANPMNRMMKSLVGQNFTQLITEKNEFSAISGLDELIDLQIDQLNMPEEQRKEFEKNFLDSFGEKAIREYGIQNYVFYPDDSVSAGDDWFRSLIISPYSIPMHLLVDVKLKEITGDLAVFISEGTLAARKTDLPRGPGDPASYDLAGTQVSEVKINLKNGLIVNSISSQFINGKVNTYDPDFPGQVIEIPLRIKSRTVMVLK